MLKKSFFYLSILLILLAISINAQETGEESSSLKWPDYIVRGTLDNGFEYIILEHKKPENRILAWLTVKSGSVHEKNEQRGMAHFIEHMGFNGSKNFEPGELIKYFASIGVDFGPDVNAFTSFDRTVYTLEVPVDKEEYVDKSLTALGDYATGMSFLPEEVEKEKGIILEELRLGKDLSTRLYEGFINILLKDSLYPERLPIGTEETVGSFTEEAVKEYYSAWYRADNMALVIVGDYNSLELEEKIKNIFGNLPAPEEDLPELLVPYKPHKDIYTGILTDPELEETSVSISYLRDPETSTTLEDFRINLCDTLIFGILNKRFSQEEYNAESPLIYASGYTSGWLTSFTEIDFSGYAKPGKALEALEVMMNYIQGFKTYGFSPVEREEVEIQLLEGLRKACEERETYEAWDYFESLNNSVMHNDVYISPEYAYELAKEILPSINEEELKERAEYLLKEENMSVILEAPPAEVSEFNEEVVLNLVKDIIASGGTPYEIKEIDYTYDYSNLEPGKIVSRKYYEELNLTELVLSNGLTVLLKPTDFDKDTVIVNYSSPGGKLLEKPENPGMYDVASIAWGKGGTEDLTPFEVERLMSQKNMRLGTGGTVLFWIYGSSAKKDMEEICQWMWQYLVRPGYREEGIEYAIKTVQEDIRTSSEYLEYVMYEEEDRLLLPGNPLSVYVTEEDIEKYRDPEELKTFQALSSVPGNSELTVLGAFELEEAIEIVCKYFGSLPAGEKPHIPYKYLETEFPSGNTERTVYKGIEDKCLGTIIFPACMYYDEDMFAVDLLAKILDVRYLDKIREKESLVYSISVSQISPLSIKGYGRFYVDFGTDPEKVDKVIELVMKEIDDIKINGPAEEELDSAKKIFLSSYEEKRETNGFWLSQLEGTSIFDYDVANLLKIEENIQKVTVEDIKIAAEKYLSEKNNIILIGMPEGENGIDLP